MESIQRWGQIAAHVEMYLNQIETDDLGWDLDSYLADPILDAKYKQVDADTVIE